MRRDKRETRQNKNLISNNNSRKILRMQDAIRLEFWKYWENVCRNV